MGRDCVGQQAILCVHYLVPKPMAVLIGIGTRLKVEGLRFIDKAPQGARQCTYKKKDS